MLLEAYLQTKITQFKDTGSWASVTSVVPAPFPVKTEPADGSGSKVIEAPVNNVGIVPFFETTGVTYTLTVIGWNTMKSGLIVPRTLATVSCTPASGSNATIPYEGGVDTVAYYGLASATKVSGDAKIYGSGSAAVPGGHFEVDTWGSGKLTVHASASAGTPKVRIFHGST